MREALELDEEKPGLVIGRDEFNGVLLHWYGVEEGADFDDTKLWKQVNPLSLVTVEALRKQRNSPSMARSTFARLHLNAWVAPDVERWFPESAWNDLCDPESGIEPGAAVTVGADGSRSYDTTALAWAHRAEDGRIDVGARVFSVRDDVPHHVRHQGRIDYEDVQDSLLELAERFQVAEVAFDPRFVESAMETVAGRLRASRVFPVEPHSRLHRDALACLERAVLEGVLRHQGDPVMAEQLAWTGVDRFENGDPRRLRKLERGRSIDVSVALALAVWRASRTDGASVYEERGVFAV
jgi:phage terminase large subunit-like protein